jgi:hypothetical protein
MNALDKVWSALADASNALGDMDDDNDASVSWRIDRYAINAAIDHATRLVIARIERDEQLNNGE